ncbi:MAG: prepilin-type N-terminal cleavage/methylation domain-containing protein [Patescibacteria group bacterium]
MNKKGFTLIELLIVVAIIGLLATLAIISLTSAQSKARDTKRVADLKSMQNALEMYYSDNSRYPILNAATPAWDTAATDSVQSMLVGGGYLTALPSPQPVGVTYVYMTNTQGTVYCLKTVLERTNVILDQDSDTADCGKTVTARIASDETVPTAATCADATFQLCLGS